MSADDQHLRASERFDETAAAVPENPAELDAWGDFSLIADHLEKTDVIALPAEFAQQVQREIQQIQRRRDLLLVLQTGFVTGLILTLVAAAALGFNWWQRLLEGVQPGNLAGLWAAFSARVPQADFDIRALYLQTEPLLRLLPGAFLAAAIAALLFEIAIFRLLRIGPFQMKTANPHTPSNLLP